MTCTFLSSRTLFSAKLGEEITFSWEYVIFVYIHNKLHNWMFIPKRWTQ